MLPVLQQHRPQAANLNSRSDSNTNLCSSALGLCVFAAELPGSPAPATEGLGFRVFGV